LVCINVFRFFGLNFRQLHSSLGEQDDVLHRQCVWSCNLDSAAVAVSCWRHQLLNTFLLVSNNSAVFCFCE